MDSEMKRVLSMGGRLKRLLDEAEAESERLISEARAKADQEINKARQEGENRLRRAQRGTGIDDLIQVEEIKAKKEAQKIVEEYEMKASGLKDTISKNRESTVTLILEEVLPE